MTEGGLNNSGRETFAVGQTVLVRSEERDVFLVGTVEGFDGADLLLSYPDLQNGRRAPASRVVRSAVWDLERIAEGPPVAEGTPWHVPAGSRRLSVLDRQRVRLVEFRRDFDWHDTDEVAQAERCTLAPDGTVEQLGSDCSVVAKSLYHPAYFAEMRRLQYLAVVDPLIDVYTTDVVTAWTWSGRAHATLDGRVVEGHLELTMRNERIDGEMKVPRSRIPVDHYGSFPDAVELRPIEDGTSSAANLRIWEAHRVHYRGSSERFSSRELEEPAVVLRFRITDLTLRFADEAATLTREVLAGAAFECWTDTFARRMPTPTPLPFRGRDHYRCLLFARWSTLYSPPASNSEPDRAALIGVVYAGAPVEGAEREAMATLLGYLLGGRLAHNVTEGFTASRRVWMRFTDRGDATTSFVEPPIPLRWSDGDAVVKIVPQIGPMMQHLADWLSRKPLGTAACIHHYTVGRVDGYPTTGLLQVSVALESLVSLVTGDDQSNAPILTSGFEPLRDALLDTLRSKFDTDETLRASYTRETFERKIEYLNQKSNGARFKALWDRAGMKLSSAERDFVRKIRNWVVHRGYVGDERSHKTLMDNYESVRRLANTFNRAFLRTLLNYDGPVLDARDADRRMAIDDGRTWNTMPGGE